MPDYPWLNLTFRLSFGGAPRASCSECTGLSLEVATEDWTEGGENRFTYKLPTRGAAPNVVLKRGLTNDRALWDWFVEFLEQGKVTLRDGQVELLAAPKMTVVRAWSFTKAYPVKWTGPDLNALSPAVAFETVELVHQGIRLVQ